MRRSRLPGGLPRTGTEDAASRCDGRGSEAEAGSGCLRMSAIAPRASAAEAPVYPSLVADVGGTNARFGWLAQAGAAVTDVQVLPVREHRSPLSAVQAYLALQQARLGAGYQAPRRLAFALATSVGGDRLELTNAHWSFSRSELQAQLGLSSLLVLNDFEALALSLPRLSAAQLRQWGGARVLPGEFGQGFDGILFPNDTLRLGMLFLEDVDHRFPSRIR
ncbi:MAG: hypothetical protein CFE41_22410 [Burkholderiales bacterium PBB2]|nr:MAG: hypothetical protein CFE41_22410 [Burkholderiales bacterium PBB2]